MSLDTTDYDVKQINHLSKDVVIVASAYCQLREKKTTNKNILQQFYQVL